MADVDLDRLRSLAGHEYLESIGRYLAAEI